MAKKSIKKLTKGSWKTSGLGLGMILLVVGQVLVALLDADPETSVNYKLILGEFMAGVGLLLARDNNKSSEETGAKGPIPGTGPVDN